MSLIQSRRKPDRAPGRDASTRVAIQLLLAAAIGLGIAAAQASPAAAQPADESAPAEPPKPRANFARPGLYLAFSAGAAFDAFDVQGPSGSDVSPSAIIGGKIGSRHNRWIATETSVDYAVSGLKSVVPGGETTEIKPLYLSGNVKLFILDGRIQPWVAGGIGGAWAFVERTSLGQPSKQTLGSFLGRVGGGLDVYVTENIFVGPEVYWNITTGDLEQFRTVSLGANIAFRF